MVIVLKILKHFAPLEAALVEAKKETHKQRDGNWLDSFGACKVCDGEMPYGHQEHCDIYKLEKERDEARREVVVLKDDRLICDAAWKHEVDQLSADNQRLREALTTILNDFNPDGSLIDHQRAIQDMRDCASIALEPTPPPSAVQALELQAALRPLCQNMLRTNGGPIDGGDTSDGKDYVMVEMSAFRAIEAAMKVQL